jgi:hypothetical protein
MAEGGVGTGEDERAAREVARDVQGRPALAKPQGAFA